ncbi:MAG: polysaccharide biosynthesis C-terminal domain-containing protein [Planctomycetes bacterium]|nr:polysaccharide biosynthesis C-terminal domain-containing protein [Planctomycetota bacterium]
MRFEFRVAEDWRSRIRGHFDFGVKGFLASLVSDLNTRVDAIMLGYFFPDATVGLYTMASTAAEGLYQFPVVIQRNVNPLVGKAFANNDLNRIEWIARKTRRIMWAIMFGIAAIAIFAYVPVIKHFLPGKGYEASWTAFVILLVGIVIQSGFAPMGGILFQGGKPGAQTMLMVYVVLTNIAMNLLLIPIWGINGAAAATGIAYVMQGMLIIVFAKRHLGVKLWP